MAKPSGNCIVTKLRQPMDLVKNTRLKFQINLAPMMHVIDLLHANKYIAIYQLLT